MYLVYDDFDYEVDVHEALLKVLNNYDRKKLINIILENQDWVELSEDLLDDILEEYKEEAYILYKEAKRGPYYLYGVNESDF